MAVRGNAVVFLSCFLEGIHVDHSHVEVAQLMQELMVDLSGYRVPLRHREFRRDRNVDLRPQPVPQPPRPHLRHVLDSWDVPRRMPDLL